MCRMKEVEALANKLKQSQLVSQLDNEVTTGNTEGKKKDGCQNDETLHATQSPTLSGRKTCSCSLYLLNTWIYTLFSSVVVKT